jgi:hypothetical protein
MRWEIGKQNYFSKQKSKEMKKKFQILILAIVAGFLFSCSKNDVINYSATDKAYFYERYMYLGYDERRLEEMTYSFAVQKSSLVKDTIKIKVRLQGRVSDYDRIVKASIVADSTTAIAGVHYVINDGCIKAGQYEGYIPVVVFRTEDLKGTTVKIKLKIVESEDLGVGVVEDNYIRLIVGDILLKPTNWPQWYGFGLYSENKYRFVIDVLGITDFPVANRYQTGPVDGIYTAAQLFAFAYKLQKAYEEYRLVNGPIYMDDSASVLVEISFNS